MKKLIAGNWKMNTNKSEAKALVSFISGGVTNNQNLHESCDFLICPPFVYISEVQEICQEHNISTGGQDCSAHSSGAYTGEVSAAMLKNCGCAYTIVGHSERRQYHGETDESIAQKAKAAHNNGLIAIICVGESEEERDADAHKEVVERQLTHSLPESTNCDNTVIAYEPVWAIGTGKTASPSDVSDMHAHIRSILESRLNDGKNIRILYGGSMKPENAGELLSTPNVDGGLIGGASLKADQFITIATSVLKS